MRATLLEKQPVVSGSAAVVAQMAPGTFRKPGGGAANDLLRLMRRVFLFGVRRHLLPSNPVANFDQQNAGGPERKRRLALRRGR
jgi:hypothetical protein